MNERIKELREQVSIDMHLHNIEDIRAMEGCFGFEGGNKIVNDYIEKFAELMVKKFDDILVLEHLDCVGNRDKQAEERIEQLREKVKTYFGVEE